MYYPRGHVFIQLSDGKYW